MVKALSTEEESKKIGLQYLTAMETVTVASIAIGQDTHPNLYILAKRDPDGLKRLLEDLKERTGSSNLEMTATVLEMDLEHERLCSE